MNLSVCYQGAINISTAFGDYNGNSIQVSMPSNILVQIYSDASCQSEIYNTHLSNSCDTCYPVNPLITMSVAGNQIFSHDFGGPVSHAGISRLKLTNKKRYEPIASKHEKNLKGFNDKSQGYEVCSCWCKQGNGQAICN
jgi:hypothetical protein